jgi:pantoate--beta-alanine ligase
MKILESYKDLQSARSSINLKVGFVPTMGALHDGHLSLMHIARGKADVVFASIFVNPTQFGPNEDFSKYPRTIDADIEKLQELADYIYIPRVEDIYPKEHSEVIHAKEASKGLEGDFRPGHFDGVATVVNILFQQVQPHVAVFGEKDYQQLMVIREMGEWRMENGEFPPQIIGAPTLREPDGLAMSSRNRYLSAQERALAPKLHETMSKLKKPEMVSAELEKLGFKVDYVEERWGRLLAAVRLGGTRLIDNIPL